MTPNLGILGIFGAVIAAGVFTMLVAPAIGDFMPLFPPVVTGSIILMIGISLMRIGVNWAAGAPVPTLSGYGSPFNLGMAAFVLILVLLFTRFWHRLHAQHRRADRHHHRLRWSPGRSAI